ncbi:MAG: hypothetical protein ACKOXO_05780 [Cyanobium sp.]
MFGSWSQKCGACANYSGTQQSAGYCRVWGAVVVQPSPLSRQCPHWSSREATANPHGALSAQPT